MEGEKVEVRRIMVKDSCVAIFFQRNRKNTGYHPLSPSTLHFSMMNSYRVPESAGTRKVAPVFRTPDRVSHCCSSKTLLSLPFSIHSSIFSDRSEKRTFNLTPGRYHGLWPVFWVLVLFHYCIIIEHSPLFHRCWTINSRRSFAAWAFAISSSLQWDAVEQAVRKQQL